MKRLHFQAPNNLGLLHDELMAAIPSLAPQPIAGETMGDGSPKMAPAMTMEGSNDDVWLGVPDDADEAAIAAVIAAHDSNATQTDPSAGRRARIAELLQTSRSSWTTAQLREIVELNAREITG